MGFALKQDEPLTKGLLRLMQEQLQASLDTLGEADNESDSTIHDIRKRMKRVRAVLRLGRYAVGQHFYKEENAAYREISRPLTEVRDAKVLIQAFDDLREHCLLSPDVHEAKLLSAIRLGLREHRRKTRTRVLVRNRALAAVKTGLEEAKSRLAQKSLPEAEWPAVCRGLKEVYRQGYRTFWRLSDPETEELHRWRKQAKYTWHQLQILQPLWPVTLQHLGREFHALTELLGDDHDLAVLQGAVQTDSPRFGGSEAATLLEPMVQPRRAELQRQAFGLGRRLFEEKPRRLAERMDAYWQAWHQDNFALKSHCA